MKNTEDFAGWVTKAEAAQITGLGLRTIERAIENGEIRREYRRQPGRPRIAVLHPEDIDRLRRQAIPVTPQVVSGAISLPAVAAPSAPMHTGLEVVASLVQAALPHLDQGRKLWLTLQEAARYSGLPEGYLRRCIKAGKLPALRTVGWRIRREDLHGLQGERQKT